MGEDYAYWLCFVIVGKYMSIIFSYKEFKIYTIEILLIGRGGGRVAIEPVKCIFTVIREFAIK